MRKELRQKLRAQHVELWVMLNHLDTKLDALEPMVHDDRWG